MMRIVVPPLQRYQALPAVHAHEHWGVQRKCNRLKRFFTGQGGERTQVSLSQNVQVAYTEKM